MWKSMGQTVTTLCVSFYVKNPTSVEQNSLLQVQNQALETTSISRSRDFSISYRHYLPLVYLSLTFNVLFWLNTCAFALVD